MRTPKEESKPQLAELQSRLANTNGKEYWRSLEEVANTEAFQSYLHREFPDQAGDLLDEESRRSFLKVMGASLALAGVSGCAIRTPEKIAPWVKAPEDVVPGKPQFFASTMTMNGLSTGVLVESHQGRPTKMEGNPSHPASLGTSDIFIQAETLALYDPDRSKIVLHEGQSSTWNDFLEAITIEVTRLRPKKGAGLRILTGAVCSPSFGGQVKSLLEVMPEAKWHRYEPVNRDNARAGSKLAFGELVDPVYHFDKADVVVSLDHDFLACGSPGRLSDERAYAARREPKKDEMNRLYVAEAAYTNTGASADHRLSIRSTRIVDLALAIAKEVGVEGANPAGLNEKQSKWAAAVGRDLKAHRSKGLLLVGDSQPAYVHAIGHAINQALGNVGPEATVHFIEPVEVDPVDHVASLTELINDIEAGKVETLIILGGNPAYDAPSDLGAKFDPKRPDSATTNFARSLRKVPTTVRLGLYDDETSEVSTWHVPQAHFLESWSDGRAFDGTVSIVQPLISPLYGGRTAHEILSVLIGNFDRSPLVVLQDHYKSQKPEGDFALFWRRALCDGVVAGTALKPKSVQPKPIAQLGEKPAPASGEYDVIIRPDPTLWDGRYANNGWLQELPKAITKLCWDNAAIVGYGLAEKLKLRKDQVIELEYQGRRIQAPVFIVPGQDDESVLIHLGYGRTRAGVLGTGRGFSAYTLRTAASPWGASGVRITPTQENYPIVSTQMQRNLEGRDHYRETELASFAANPGIFHEGTHHSEDSLTPLWEYDSYAWGMAIDLNTCTGCNACVISCVAENNIPVIGKEQMGVGRNMQWMEIDTYFHTPNDQYDQTETYFQPRTCMHCENAPCELVCPVAATVHDAEGLNVMVYNRCVGTRYCGNNCPYKVRHFNYLTYTDQVNGSLKLLNNPDVTVRSRGVMEKCTYCVQRISAARIASKETGTKIKDGDVRTACQAACPSQAIHFGDIKDPNSKVAKIKAEERNYQMLGELNTRPRTTYLGKIRNLNPELVEA